LRVLPNVYLLNLGLVIISLGLTVANSVFYLKHIVTGVSAILNLGISSGLFILTAVGYYFGKRDYEKRKIQQSFTGEKSDRITN